MTTRFQLDLEEGSEPEFSDDETSPLTQDGNQANGGGSSQENSKSWDVFRTIPPSASSLSENNQDFFDVAAKVLKIVAYILTFGMVLAAAVMAKGIVLFMTSQLKKDKEVPICSEDYQPMLSQEKDYIATLPKAENVSWAWMLFFCYLVPEGFTFLRSARICFFKSWKKPLLVDFFWVWVFETLHTVGTSMLIYLVLPDLDVIKGAMLTNCVAFIPGLLGLFSRTRKEANYTVKVTMDAVAILCQLSGMVVWPLVEGFHGNDSWRLMLIPPAVLLTSCGWWENYVDRNSSYSLIQYLGGIKNRLWKTRYFTYLFISVWKCIVFFVMMVVTMGSRLNDFDAVFNLELAFRNHNISVTEVRVNLDVQNIPDYNVVAPFQQDLYIMADYNTPVYVFLIQMLTAWVAYVFGKFACKICIQGFSFALPVNLTIPVTLSLLISACGLRYDDPCCLKTIPSYLLWECKNGDILNDFIIKDFAWVWVFWILSQTWITLHIWSPKSERLASTEKLFVTPQYNALLIDQSMALNRRKDNDRDIKPEDVDLKNDERKKEMDEYYDNVSIRTNASSNKSNSKIKSSDQITRIYAVATMWHETQEEMMEFLKSILRMDEDQCARRVAQKFLKIVDPDYYEFETQVFFDDAFEIDDDNEDENVVNQFVRLMVNLMDEAATHVHETNIRIRPPKKYPTPYGGRLVWTLPGKTKLVVHLKDKSKIRHKKRWSQVMYMYYLLGYKLMDQAISVDRKEVIADNTFLLALDGDIDFNPNAVALLIDRMKINTNLGAACGRIHPIGSGLMVWYQMFEYAVGHWMQKATEHMIGCVLCSPGCFSLFRGKALMDDNIMAKYTTVSSQARHYVQYDQGEDRWLCTLLLQRGYRVEYSAASDAYTHAPEGFSEFYNQRRRWVPSTMANIMDLLEGSKKAVEINDNISFLYIVYQIMLMVGTILGPGTIFLMLVGSFTAAFPGKIDNGQSFIYNAVPIIIFMLSCIFTKSSVQISIAYVLTAIYALVMVVVLVSLMVTFSTEGWFSPSSLFFFTTAGSFIITGILHPRELSCLPCGMIYYMLVPSMYLLLQVYSCFNLNNVSWGTREVAAKQKKKTREEVDAEKKAAEEAKKAKKKDGFLSFLTRERNEKDDEGSIEFSLAGLFKIMCCVHPKPNDQNAQLTSIANSLEILKKRFEGIESHMGINPSNRRRSTIRQRLSVHGELLNTAQDEDPFMDSDTDSHVSAPREERDDLVNPYWMEDKHLKRGEVDYMPSNEVQFFKDLIEQYLKPLEKNDLQQKKTESELKDLRNMAVFSFSMMNAVFIITIFLLQIHQDILYINWFLGVKTNITYNPLNAEVIIVNTYLKLEPIGFVFVIFFASIMAIQFTGMLFHRFGTMSHILASTELNLFTRTAEDMTEDAFIQRNAVNIVKEFQKLKGIDGDADDDGGQDVKLGRRKTIHNLEKHRQNKQAISTLDVAFKKRFFSISAEATENENPMVGNMRRMSMRRDTLRALAERRESVVKERRMSRMAPRKTSFAVDVQEIP